MLLPEHDLMDPENSEDRLHKTYFVTIVIGVAMIVSLFVYAGVVEYFKRTGESFGKYSGYRHIAALRYLFIVWSSAVFFLARIISRRILEGKLTTERAGYRQADRSLLIQRLSQSSLVVYALCESIGVCGLVLFLASGRSIDFYLFFSVSLVAFIAYFPRYRRWDEWIRTEMDKLRQRGYY